jgi:hypothetical protein
MDRHPFLTVLGAEVITAALVVVGWNLWQRFHDDGVGIGAGLRSVLRF